MAGLAGFHPSNLPVSLTLPKSLSATTLSGTVTFDTDALTLSGGMDAGQWNTMTVTMSGGYEAAVAVFDTFTLASGATLQITGRRPLILVANGNLEIDGTIVGVKSPTNGWYGGGPPAPSSSMRAGQCALNVLAGGGGPADIGAEMGAAGGGYCGRGGNGSTVADGGGSPSPGGIPYGTPSLVPLAGGSSGGSSNGSDITNHGGGAIELVSGSLLTIGDNGTVNLGGGGTDPGYAVGGGSGGGILLEAPTVIVRGILTVNGGSGSAVGNGGSQPGQPSLQPAVGGGKVAGNGSAGANIIGGDALLQSNPAGGGGGAGEDPDQHGVQRILRTLERRHHLADQRNGLLYDWVAQLRSDTRSAAPRRRPSARSASASRLETPAAERVRAFSARKARRAFLTEVRTASCAETRSRRIHAARRVAVGTAVVVKNASDMETRPRPPRGYRKLSADSAVTSRGPAARLASCSPS